jgi:hypothetical protein
MSNDKFTFGSAGEIQKLEFAFARANYSHIEVNKLSEGDLLANVRQVLIAKAEIKPINQGSTSCWIPIGDGKTMIAVHLGAIPKLPFDGAIVESHQGEGWILVERRRNGLYIGGRKVMLYCSKHQHDDASISGHELRKEIMGECLNSNILDALYENIHLIPEDWKKDENGNTRYICFWGTIYRRLSGFFYVRGLCFGDGIWRWFYFWLGDDFDSRHSSALLAE